jgi:hypothetical protein
VQRGSSGTMSSLTLERYIDRDGHRQSVQYDKSTLDPVKTMTLRRTQELRSDAGLLLREGRRPLQLGQDLKTQRMLKRNAIVVIGTMHGLCPLIHAVGLQGPHAENVWPRQNRPERQSRPPRSRNGQATKDPRLVERLFNQSLLAAEVYHPRAHRHDLVEQPMHCQIPRLDTFRHRVKNGPIPVSRLRRKNPQALKPNVPINKQKIWCEWHVNCSITDDQHKRVKLIAQRKLTDCWI